MKNLYDFFVKIDEYYEYLKERGQKFTKEGLPIIEAKCFAEHAPDVIVPFYKRTDKRLSKFKSVAICSFAPDKYIYPRIDRAFDDIEKYKKYDAVIAADVTVTADMDEEWQKAIMLLNLLFMAVLAINGIKIIANTRTGNLNSWEILKCIPESVMVASGFLGCSKGTEYNYDYIAKILYLKPAMVLIYGKCDEAECEKLRRMGIKFKIYKDYHKLSKELRYENV